MKYLFIGAHPDDIELCCGGTIIKLAPFNDIHVEVMSGMNYYGKNLFSEYSAAMYQLGVTSFDSSGFDFRMFEYHRQEILQRLVDLRKIIKPDIVFTHSSEDYHQDHATIGHEARRAFKDLSLVTFTGAWNEKQITKNHFEVLSTIEVIKKITALKCYESQQSKSYFTEDSILAELRINGLKIGVEYAEAFNINSFIKR